MRKIINTILFVFLAHFVNAQSNLLSADDYKILRDSCTSVDVLFTTAEGGSISIEGRNVKLFSSFVDVVPAKVTTGAFRAAVIMWQRNGREFLTGNAFLRDTWGYIVFKKDGVEFVHALTSQGVAFLQQEKDY